MKELATTQVGTNVLEVQEDPEARTPLDFYARLYVSAMAAACPEMYIDSTKVWSEKTQASNVSGEANDNPMNEVDGGALVEGIEPSGSGSKKTASKKTKSGEVGSAVTETSARGEESSEQSVLSGNAAKRTRPTLPLSTCYNNTRPEYAKYFVNLLQCLIMMIFQLKFHADKLIPSRASRLTLFRLPQQV